MTRKEQQIEKAKKEKQLLESFKGKYLNQQEKAKFRETSVWKEFRKKFSGKQDPITLKKLPKRYNLHHMNLNSCFYTELKESNFVPLNGTTHDIVHFLYGYYRKDKNVLKRLKKILDKMIEINDGKDICDFRKEYKEKSK